jgi:MraZ protein
MVANNNLCGFRRFGNPYNVIRVSGSDLNDGSSKLFLGKHLCTLDKQNRLLVPDAIREQLAGALFISQGFERNLLILKSVAFQEVYRQVISLNIADPLARLLLRMILGTAHETTIDAQARIGIPDELRNFAGLTSDALLVGQGDYLEVWSTDLWKKQETEIEDAEKNSSRFSSLTVVAH